jgi:probable lipoprotein NlpC
MIKKRLNLLFLFPLLFIVACSSKKNLNKNIHGKVLSPSTINKYAGMMNVSPRNINNKQLYSFIDNWMGTKYRYGGLQKSGIDCSGLVYLLFKEVYNKELPRNTSQQANVIKKKYENQLKEGDLVFFDYDGKKLSHVGVFLQNGYYVHASTQKGVIISKLKDPYTYKYFSKAGSVN